MMSTDPALSILVIRAIGLGSGIMSGTSELILSRSRFMFTAFAKSPSFYDDCSSVSPFSFVATPLVLGLDKDSFESLP